MLGFMRIAVAAGSIIAVLVFAPAAYAHETVTSGSLTLTLGWEEEPAYAGQANAVELEATGAAGPAGDPAASLSVQVSFGDTATTLPMRPGSEPGVYLAKLIPTEAGTYAFHVRGTLSGEPVDLESTCSAETFDCVIDTSEIQFPASDPSESDLARRLERERSRVEAAQGETASAKRLAIIALALAAVSLVMSVLRRRRRPETESGAG
jgi:hypothetical protein